MATIKQPKPPKYDLIPIEQLFLWEEANVRKTDVYDGIEDLVNNIRKIGLQVPLLVKEDKPKEKYLVVSGQRRLIACQKIGMNKVPCLIRTDIDLTEAKLLSLSENQYREDMNPVDRSKAIMELLKVLKKPEKIAERLGVTPNTVRNYIEYESLPPSIKEFVSQRKMTYTQALHLFRKFPDENVAYEIAKKFVRIRDKKKKRAYYQAIKDSEPTATPKDVAKRANQLRRMQSFRILLPMPTSKVIKDLAKQYDQDPADVIAYIVQEWVSDFSEGKVKL